MGGAIADVGCRNPLCVCSRGMVELAAWSMRPKQGARGKPVVRVSARQSFDGRRGQSGGGLSRSMLSISTRSFSAAEFARHSASGTIRTGGEPTVGQGGAQRRFGSAARRRSPPSHAQPVRELEMVPVTLFFAVFHMRAASTQLSDR